MKTITVPDEFSGKRLDIFLAETYPEFSRAHWQKHIKRITVNDEYETKHYKVEARDIISIPDETFVKTEIYAREPIEQPRIIDEADEYAIVYKPINWIMHRPDERAKLNPHLYVSDWFVGQYPEAKIVGEHALRPGIVHRIDTAVSGIVVMCKTQNMYEHMKKQFMERAVEKTYAALAHGHFSKVEDSITFAIAKKEFGTMRAVAKNASEREHDDRIKHAQTDFVVAKQWKHHALVDISLLTGRTHQIRSHFYAYGHPIVGDKKYTNPKLVISNIPAPRLMLQSCELSFMDEAGNRQTYAVPLDHEMEKCIERLGNPIQSYTLEP